MNNIDPLGTSLYFSAAAGAAQEVSNGIKKKEKAEKTKRLSFSSVLKKNIDAQELAEAGFPSEIAGLSVEAAAGLLKDRMDAAGDRLTGEMSADAFSEYRLAINQFIRYIVKNTFVLEQHKRPGISRRTGLKRDPLIQIQVINQKLDQLAADMLANHAEKLKLLARVNEIQGLVVDLMVA
jgi:uncharacterized protein